MKPTLILGKMETNNFHVFAQDACKIINARPAQDSIIAVLSATLHKISNPNIILIARHQWLKRRGLEIPAEEELLNLCITIKNGKLIRAFYSNTLTNIIKKQNYEIWILN